MARSRVALYALAFLLVGTVAVARAPLGATSAASAAITFETPTVVDPIHTNGDTTPGSDRQWFAVYDPAPTVQKQSAYTGATPLVYLVWNNLVGPGPNSGEQWSKSTDGLNYTNATADVTPATESSYSPFG